MLQKTDVINGATATLRQFPLLERRVTVQAIESCVESAWDRPPHPLVFLLWVAGGDLVGKDGAMQLLRTVETFLALQEKGAPVISGAWQSRLNRILPGRSGGTFENHYSNYQSAMFELVLACRLVAKDIEIVISGEHDRSVCDLGVLAAASAMVAVEAYAPRKGAERWYRETVERPWVQLMTDQLGPAPVAQPEIKDITFDPDAAAQALARVLTDGNFQKQKAIQLSAGGAPTLLAVRGYGLTADDHHLFTLGPPLKIAEQMGGEAWSHLPAQCLGLLLSLLGDVLKLDGRRAPAVFIPAPGRMLSRELWEYMRRADILSTDVLVKEVELVVETAGIANPGQS